MKGKDKMKKIILTLCAASALCLWAAEDDFSFRPGLPGWAKSNLMAVYDSEVKISESGSLKLTGQSSVLRRIQLEPDSEYEISVYIKAENVTGEKYRGVLLRLTDGKKYFAVTGDPKNMPRQGSFDWTKCVRTVKGSFFQNGKVIVVPALTCEGTAWFDDIRIEKKKIIPKGDNAFRKQYLLQVGMVRKCSVAYYRNPLW